VQVESVLMVLLESVMVLMSILGARMEDIVEGAWSGWQTR